MTLPRMKRERRVRQLERLVRVLTVAMTVLGGAFLLAAHEQGSFSLYDSTGALVARFPTSGH